MANFTIDVTELDRYVHQLREVSDAGALAFADIAGEFRDKTMETARQLVPVRTGDLKGSIRPVAGEASRLNLTAAWEVGMPYAGFVEYGVGRGPEQPFVRPALRMHNRAYREALARRAKEMFRVNLGVSRPLLQSVQDNRFSLRAGVTQPR